MLTPLNVYYKNDGKTRGRQAHQFESEAPEEACPCRISPEKGGYNNILLNSEQQKNAFSNLAYEILIFKFISLIYNIFS